MQGDGRNAGAILEVAIDMNIFSIVTGAAWWVDVVGVCRSLLMAEREEGENVAQRTVGD